MIVYIIAGIVIGAALFSGIFYMGYKTGRRVTITGLLQDLEDAVNRKAEEWNLQPQFV